MTFAARHVTVLITVVWLSTGCGNTPPGPQSDAATPGASAPLTESVSERSDTEVIQDPLVGIEAEVSGMDLYMHDIEPTENGPRKPTLWVHAARGERNSDNTWALAGATAVIYREQEADVRLESSAGRFDAANKVAVLDGGVRVAAGAMSLETDSVSYNNEFRRVDTMSPVTLTDGETTLNADAAMLETEDGVVTLTNVSGLLSLAGDYQ